MQMNGMKPRRRVILLIVIMILITAIVESITIGILYRTALEQETARLTETARSQARLIEAIARYDKKYSRDDQSDPTAGTLSQIIEAHGNYNGFGKTGEFTLARRERDTIVFILNHRHYDLSQPKPVPFNSSLAEPMKLALSGKSGAIIGKDYRGETVLAAHEPVAELDLGIVAKIDMTEIRAPFIKAGIISAIIGLASLFLGALLFIKVTNPIIEGLSAMVNELQESLNNVKTLKGLLPICASCKKIRDDSGYWNQIELYIMDHSDADFSHSLCPDCADKMLKNRY